jgi:hypothetical protein
MTGTTVTLHPHWHKQNQCVMNQQLSTSISGKLVTENLVGEGGAERSEASGEGFVRQSPHHRPTAKRIRNFAKKMRREPTDAEAVCSATDALRLSNFVAKSPLKTSFSTSLASKSASSSKSMAVSMHRPIATPREIPF